MQSLKCQIVLSTLSPNGIRVFRVSCNNFLFSYVENKLPTNSLSVFDHFVGLAFKGLTVQHVRRFAQFGATCTVSTKNVKNIHRGVLVLVKLQTLACNFTISITPPWVFCTFFKLYKWYRIAIWITYGNIYQESIMIAVSMLIIFISLKYFIIGVVTFPPKTKYIHGLSHIMFFTQFTFLASRSGTYRHNLVTGLFVQLHL